MLEKVRQYDPETDIDTSNISVVPLLADRDMKLTKSDHFLVKFVRPDVF